MWETNGGRGVRWYGGSGGRSYELDELAMLVEDVAKKTGEKASVLFQTRGLSRGLLRPKR